MRVRSHRYPRRSAIRGLAGVVTLALALLSGCTEVEGTATTVPVALSGHQAAVAEQRPPAVLAESRPQRLRIPKIDVDAAGLLDLGLKPDGSMEVPPDGSTVGWYTESPTPGERGPAVLAAHVDWDGEEGAFYDLRELLPGDAVMVDRADGTTALFRVYRVEQYPKDRFPSDAVYGNVPDAQLRLITCGGEVDTEQGGYRDNIVVYARLDS